MRRFVISGIGAVSPYGIGLPALWDGLCSGSAALGPVTLFPVAGHRTTIAGQVPLGARDGSRAGASAPECCAARAQETRADRMAALAAREAVHAARLATSGLPPRTGVFFGSSAAGMYEGERFYADLRGRGAGRPRVQRIVGQPNGSPAEAVAREFRIGGPVECVASACAASTMAVESALASLRAGEVDCALVGGTDALCELTFGGFNSLRAMSPEPCQPFRSHRQGLNLGEGAAWFVLEDSVAAAARGAAALAEVAGAASSCDAHHMTAPDPAGGGAARAMAGALLDACESAETVDFLSAHGTGTTHNDAAEWRAIAAVFGARAATLPVCAIKASVGHLLGACGALELAAAVCSLQTGILPPAPSGGAVDPDCPVDLVLGSSRRLHRARLALSVNLAFGGMNSAVVLRAAGGA